MGEQAEQKKGKKILQPVREKAIKTMVARYQKLTDSIFDEVEKKLPAFTDHVDEEDQVITSAEEKKYAHIKTRMNAMNMADEMMKKTNELEFELNNPAYVEENGTEIITTQSQVKEEVNKVHPTKRHAQT